MRVDIWATRAYFTGDLDWLTPADQARAQAYKHDGARAQFLTGRALLRDVLEPRGLDYTSVDLSGEKPTHPDTFFNLSHVDGFVAVALASEDVGLDVETTLRGTDIDLVGKRQYTPAELAWIAASDDPRRAFFQLWTLKEAYLKLTGEGLRRDTKTFAFDLKQSRFEPPTDRPKNIHFWRASVDVFELAVAAAIPFELSFWLDGEPVFLEGQALSANP